MALDSRDKRFSAVGIISSVIPSFPNPDGDIDTALDRQHTGYLYRGIAATTEVAVAVTEGPCRRYRARMVSETTGTRLLRAPSVADVRFRRRCQDG